MQEPFSLKPSPLKKCSPIKPLKLLFHNIAPAVTPKNTNHGCNLLSTLVAQTPYIFPTSFVFPSSYMLSLFFFMNSNNLSKHRNTLYNWCAISIDLVPGQTSFSLVSSFISKHIIKAMLGSLKFCFPVKLLFQQLPISRIVDEH